MDAFGAEGARPEWTVRWPVRNEGTEAIRVLAAVHPHSQFRGPQVPLERSIRPGEQIDLAVPVRFDEKPGAIVENPFLILTIEHGGVLWRVLARVRIAAGSRGEPIADGQVIVTTNRVGAVGV